MKGNPFAGELATRISDIPLSQGTGWDVRLGCFLRYSKRAGVYEYGTDRVLKPWLTLRDFIIELPI